MRAGIRLRLLIFVAIGAIAVGFAGARYAGLGSWIKSTDYPVTLHLKNSGGIFAGAEVTYRGVAIGRVRNVDVERDGVVAMLAIGHDWKVPNELTAEIHNRSAVGEQYVDLVPRRNGGPYLAAGDEIQRAAASTPVQEETLLLSLDRFTRSINTTDLHIVVNELGIAMEGAGPDLQRLLDGSGHLIDAAQKALPETLALLRDGGTVLKTQNAQSQLIADYLSNLNSVSGVLRVRDPELRKIVNDGSRTAKEVSALVAGLKPNLQPLLANLVDLSGIFGAHRDGIEQALVALPISLYAGPTTARGGEAHFTLVQTRTPEVCRQGYIPANRWRSVHDVSIIPPFDDVRCAEPLPVLPRGAKTAKNARRAPWLNRSIILGRNPSVATDKSWTTLFTAPLTLD